MLLCEWESLMFAFSFSRGGWRWLRDRPPGLLRGLPAGWGDHPVWHLPQSVPPGLSGPGAGEGSRGQMELSALCEYISVDILMKMCFFPCMQRKWSPARIYFESQTVHQVNKVERLLVCCLHISWSLYDNITDFRNKACEILRVSCIQLHDGLVSWVLWH